MTFSPLATGGRKITSVAVESDPQRYQRTTDDCDRALIELIIGGTLLHESTLKLQAAFAAAIARAHPDRH
ncbi:hypothetical protein [Nocardia sp. NPDC056100]|uniref:hypothetical protein n=1 Tax=Nocardia sp. NPDC056100 TaxID=3345712 RepID=UPI0035DAFE61